MEIKIVNPLSDPDWDRLVLSHPDYNFFHCAAWAKVLAKTYGHTPLYLFGSQAGEPIALVPLMEVRSLLTGRRGVCLPFSDFCGPLLFDEARADLVMEKLSELARERNWRYFEIRGQRKVSVSGAPAVTFYGHRLDLRSGIEKLPAGFTHSVRGSIRKAQRSGLNVQVTSTREALLEFYWLHARTRKHHGLPPQPLSFFLNIYEQVIKPGLGFVVLASNGSGPIAGGIFFRLGKWAIYKFSASDKAFQELRGNNLVTWEGIRYLAQNGAETLHFGRTSLKNEGLRRFKVQWGTVEETIEYFNFNTRTGGWVSDRARGTASGFRSVIFSKLPLTLTRLAGAIIYPHLD
jgi:hypothetical protein